MKRKNEKKVDRGGEKKKRAQNLNKSLTYEGFFVKSFGADEQPLNPLSPVCSPPDSPRASLHSSRNNSSSSKRLRLHRHRSLKTTSASGNEGFAPSSALSDSEIEIAHHRGPTESKSGKCYINITCALFRPLYNS